MYTCEMRRYEIGEIFKVFDMISLLNIKAKPLEITCSSHANVLYCDSCS